MFGILAIFLMILGATILVTFYAASGLIYALLIVSILVTLNGVAKGKNI